MTLGEKLTKLRKENNLTQEQFADILHVSRQSISKWELNQVYPDTEKLITICKLFNCSTDYLLKDEVESMDTNITIESEHAKEIKVKSYILTYLSFPPLFGFIVGIYSLIFQMKNQKNKKLIVISVLGAVFSLGLTVAMLLGIILNL